MMPIADPGGPRGYISDNAVARPELVTQQAGAGQEPPLVFRVGGLRRIVAGESHIAHERVGSWHWIIGPASTRRIRQFRKSLDVGLDDGLCYLTTRRVQALRLDRRQVL